MTTYRALWRRVRKFSGIAWIARKWRPSPLYWHMRDTSQLLFFGFLSFMVAIVVSFAFLAYAAQLGMQRDRQRAADLDCLARNVYFEARGEPLDGQRAVAEVTMNRVNSARFPDTVCEVVHEQRWDAKRQRLVGAFSWTELPPPAEPAGGAWRRARSVAESAYDGLQAPMVRGALHYHADHIEPDWARSQNRLAKIGRHIFYE
ncbi:MAG: cell wall hydrolase [Woeseiaceae bacterium]